MSIEKTFENLLSQRNGWMQFFDNPPDYDECRYYFKWQHAKRELLLRKQDHLLLKTFAPLELHKYFEFTSL